MAKLAENSILVLAAAVPQLRSNDVEYSFSQDNNFLYLTNFPEPHAIAVLESDKHSSACRCHFFCLPQDAHAELWTGQRIGCKKVLTEYAADYAYPIARFDEMFMQLATGKQHCYYNQVPARGWQWDTKLKRLLTAAAPACALTSINSRIHEMRLLKSKMEVQKLQQAAEVSARAHCRAMQVCRPGMYEYEIEAELEYVFKQSNMHNAYPCIVGGGKNACTLHYIRNDAQLRKGDLLLVDAGAEYQNYAADISRTYPVSGQFSPAQRDLYELVLEAQTAAIAQVRPGNSIAAMHRAAVRTLTRGLKELGLLQGSVETLIRKQAYRRFYMHNTGHWLGMDVHDVGAYQLEERWRCFKPGMVTTVEPGLYLRADKDIPVELRNTGVRIEDDVLVTHAGAQVLSSAVPKKPQAIEALMNA